jgi:hypothetical protein
MEQLLLSCGVPSSPTLCRFIPALSKSYLSPGKKMEISMTEIANLLGLTTPAVSIATRRREKIDMLLPK